MPPSLSLGHTASRNVTGNTWWNGPSQRRRPAASLGPKRTSALAVALGLSAALMVSTAPAHANTSERPATVRAVYAITFLGVEIGKFHFNATLDGSSYRLSGNAAASAMFGAVKWSGSMAANGQVRAGSPEPDKFTQTTHSKRKVLFKSKKKHQRTELTFANGRVASAKLEPPAKTGDRVPLKPGHLVGVVDPLSAVLALSQFEPGSSPCNRRVEVFTGKHRLRLALEPSGKRAVRGRSGDISGAVDHTCRVSYVPIAGHKREDSESKHIERNGAIKMVLRELPAIGMVIPRAMSFSTVAGDAAAVIESVEVVTNRKRRIALAGN